MYGGDNFSSWLLMPSGPDEFLFSSLDIYVSAYSSQSEIYGVGKTGAAHVDFVRRNPVEYLNTQTQPLFVVLLMTLPRKGSDCKTKICCEILGNVSRNRTTSFCKGIQSTPHSNNNNNTDEIFLSCSMRSSRQARTAHMRRPVSAFS